MIKTYTLFEKDEIEAILKEHFEAPEKRIAQKALARGVTEVLHGRENANAIENLIGLLFDKNTNFAEFSEDELKEFGEYLPTAKKGSGLIDLLVDNGLAESKKKAREFISQGAITINGEKVKDDIAVDQVAIVKKGKNKFVVVK